MTRSITGTSAQSIASACSLGIIEPNHAKLTETLSRFSSAETSETTNTARTLPSATWTRGTGASSSVSRVPRSFSPAPMSVAG